MNEENKVITIHDLFKQTRLKSGLTQEELGIKLKYPASLISKIENGKYNFGINGYKKLSKFLKISIADLMEMER